MDAPVLNKAVNHIVLNTNLTAAFFALFFFTLKSLSMFVFLLFAYGTSFLHFIYDGMIWRIRRPKVAQEVGVVAAG